jgi:NAD(P)-dependent dehydrogenase (short-subunit alcohol dehydrogenase family)
MAGIALVTGGSGGIGAATAIALAREGWDVAITYRTNREGGDAVAAAVRAQGRRGLAVHADTAVEADVVAAFRAVDRELGTVAALVNNAGIVGKGSRVADLTAEALERVLAVNVTGCFLCAREAVRRMSTRLGGKGGGIVNVSSAAARLGSPGEFVHYAASKGALDTFTLGLGREVADEGIRVNAVRPGMIDTEIHVKSGLAERVARIVPTVPMRRLGTAEEVAETIAWLLSDGASYVTCAIVDVAGGR